MSPPRRRRARFAWAALALVLAYPATYLVLRVSQHWVLCTSELRTGIEARGGVRDGKCAWGVEHEL